MPNCDFYATENDHEGLLTWLFQERSCEVYELASAYEKPLRRFSSAEEVLSLFQERYSNGQRVRSVHLQLYVLGASPPFVPRRVALNPAACGGATFRYAAEGWGLVQLYLGTVWREVLENSHTNHNSQRRAQAWSDVRKEGSKVEEWDFGRITAFSGRLNRQIKKMSVAKLGSRPVLPDAYELWKTGTDLPPFRHDSTEAQCPGA
jgi:hypothetical protein